MPKKVGQEEFIERCRKFHGEAYDYSRTIYVAAKKDIFIGCPKHGFFKTNAWNHSVGSGCPECGLKKSNATKFYSTDVFIEKSLVVHKGRYDYSRVEYKGSLIPVLIGCNIHGFFEQIPSAHLCGKGCKACKGNNISRLAREKGIQGEEYFQKCRDVHENKYAYPPQYFDGLRKKIQAICPMHGLFKIDAGPHLRLGTGCQACGHDKSGDAKRRDEVSWLEQVRRVHGNRYDYDLSDWTGSLCIVRITCKKHGLWTQQALKHAQGQGCPKCARERLMGRWQPQTMSTELANAPCYFYYLQLSSQTESFYKVGISNNVKRRAAKIRRSGYKVRIIEEILGTTRTCIELEKATFKEFDALAAYVPLMEFMGDGECFSSDILCLDEQSHIKT